jgi:hypothetical protein
MAGSGICPSPEGTDIAVTGGADSRPDAPLFFVSQLICRPFLQADCRQTSPVKKADCLIEECSDARDAQRSKSASDARNTGYFLAKYSSARDGANLHFRAEPAERVYDAATGNCHLHE